MADSNSQSQMASANGHEKIPQIPFQNYIIQPDSGKEDGFELNPRWILLVLQRRAVLIASLTIAVTLLVLAWAFTRPKIYLGSFQLQIEPAISSNNLQQLLSEALRQSAQIPNNSNNSVDYDTQISVLKSNKVLDPIVKRIQSRYPDINYGTLYYQLKIERGDGSADKTAAKNQKILTVRYQDSDSKQVKFILDTVAQGFLSYSLEDQEEQLNQGIKFIDSQIPQLQSQVNQLQGEKLSLLRTHSLTDPASQGQQLAERVSSINEQKLDTQVQLNTARTSYAKIEKQLGVTQSQAIVQLALSDSSTYQNLLNQLQEVDTKLAEDLTKYTSDHPIILDLQDQRRNLLALLNKEGQRVLGNKAIYSELKSANLTPQNSLDKQLTSDLVNNAIKTQELQTTYQDLAAIEGDLKQQVREYPSIQKKYDNIELKLEVAADNLRQILIKKQALQLEVAQQVIPWILLNPVNARPDSPDTLKMSLLGLILGLLLGLGAAFTLEKLDDTFHKPEDIEDEIPLPLLGIIPFLKNLRLIEVQAQELQPVANLSQLRTSIVPVRQLPESSFIAAFRSLYANIRFLNSTSLIKSLVISSGKPLEGKTTVAANLATVAATMGHRVLLVDSDLRSPKLHHHFGISNSRGLSEAIATETVVENLFQTAPNHDQLFILTAGQDIDDPIKLLSSQKMQQLMNHFSSLFDMVIYDTTSLWDQPDANFIASQADGIVLVVGLETITQKALKRVINGLSKSNVLALGVVANTLK